MQQRQHYLWNLKKDCRCARWATSSLRMATYFPTLVEASFRRSTRLATSARSRRVTEVHRPPAPASELSKYHGACIFEELGSTCQDTVQLPRGNDVSTSDCVSFMAITESCHCGHNSFIGRFVAKLPAGSEAVMLEKEGRGVHTESLFAC